MAKVRKSKTDSRGARHSAATAEHYSPPDYVAAARRLMRGIDLDPASCAKANEVVQAARYLTKKDDGLTAPWAGTIFLNPPGGSKIADGTRTPSLVKPFWKKLVREYIAGNVEQAIWIGYSMEQLQTLQCMGGEADAAEHSPLDFPLCFPRRRIAFLGSDLRVQNSPTHANYIAFLPPRWRSQQSITDFETLFGTFGAVRTELRCRLEALDEDPRQLRLVQP